MERKRIVVTGDLRGTGYASGGWRKAHALMVGGFMDKLKDGSVLFEVEGRPEDVARFIEWAERGSPKSVIGSVTVTSLEPLGETEFRKAERGGDAEAEAVEAEEAVESADSSDDSEDGDDSDPQAARKAARKAERKARRRAEKRAAE